MSSFSRFVGGALLAVALVVPLAACTGLRPVYSEGAIGGAHRVDVAYAEPGNRLEQLIYQDLALKLGKAQGSAVPTVKVSAWRGSADLTRDTVSSPFSERVVTVSAALTITAPDGTVLFSGVRSQTADVRSGAQSLANEETSRAGDRQAALLLADTLRLQILATLSK